jgi:hypothetical protein
MRIIAIVFFSLLFSSASAFSQEYKWNLIKKYAHKNIEAWDINPMEELIISTQGTLHKLDTNFQVVFKQSKKEFGDISKIDARHSLKTLLFSKNQQMLGFVDNTLAYQDGKIDLATLNVDYATLVCYSDQTSRFWVYDQPNARLIRFEGIRSSVKRSEITNLTSITLQNFPTAIIESQNQLLLFYKGSGVFVFDYYGSLLRKFDYPEAFQVYPSGNFIYLLRKNEIIKVDRKSGEEFMIPLPILGIEDFRIFGNAVYFKDSSGVKKYSLIQAK